MISTTLHDVYNRVCGMKPTPNGPAWQKICSKQWNVNWVVVVGYAEKQNNQLPFYASKI